MSKPGKSLKALCKKLGVRLTVKRGKKRVYKSLKVLKGQCKRKAGKKKRRRRKFGSSPINKSPITRGQNIATVGMEPPEHDFSYLMTPIRHDSSGRIRRKVNPRKRDSDEMKAAAQIIKEANKDRKDMWRVGFQDDPQGKYEELLKERLNKRKRPYPLTFYQERKRDRADVGARIQRATMKAKETLAAHALANLGDNFEQRATKRQKSFGKKKKVSRKKGPSATLKKLCKKLGVRLTVKRGKKRVYKSEKVLKKQCTKKRRRKFGDRTTLRRKSPQKRKVVKKNPPPLNQVYLQKNTKCIQSRCPEKSYYGCFHT